MANALQSEEIGKRLAEAEEGSGRQDDGDWLATARDAYNTSTDYMEGSLKKQWEKNMSAFRSKHAAGSKYYTEAYKNRSKIYRPKTRSTTTRHMAAAAMAYFSTNDAVHISAEDDQNPAQRLSAEIRMELLNYRLDNPSPEEGIPWFATLVGAYQESMNIGCVVSYQHWSFIEKIVKTPTGQMAFNNETGQEEEQMNETRKIVRDKPTIELRPMENIRIDSAADWTDPINTSPYLIDQIPMYVYEVKARMKDEDNKTGEKPWVQLSDGEIMSAIKNDYDSLRREREGSSREDSKDVTTDFTDYDIVWVHRNFIRKDNEEFVYYTLGTQFLLSEPATIEEIYFQSYRPYVMGVSEIEAHRTFPTGLPELGEQVQNEINSIANSRIDNINLAINQRYYVRRGADVDYMALKRSAPGSGILMDDINADVKPEEIGDVTSSSYSEQDRLNLDFDDITGGFSPSTMQSNRNMNETVGVTEKLSEEGNIMSEFKLRIFNETWVEPVLKQVMANEVRYETDERVIAICGRRANIEKKYKIKLADWRMFQAPAVMKVSVGFGATSPQKRIEKLALGLNAVGKFMPQMMQGLDEEEVISEIFGALGHKDGKRFFKSLQDDGEENAEVTKLKEELGKMKQIIESKQAEKQAEGQVKMQIEQVKVQGNLQRDQMKYQAAERIKQVDLKLEYIDRQLAAEKNQLVRGELILQQEALIWSKRMDEIGVLQGERDRVQDKISDGEDKVGVVSRDQYGAVPYAEG